MNPNYNQNYTKEDIENILYIIKECIRSNKYTISFNQNRRENIAFVNDYNIRSDKQKSILLNLMIFVTLYRIQILDMNMKCCMFLYLK